MPRTGSVSGSPEPAIELLQAAVGSDLHQLAGELDKLASYVQGRDEEIGEDAVAAIVGVRRGETQADLLDAIADRNVSRSLELISPRSSSAENNRGLSRHGIVDTDAGNLVGARKAGRRSLESPPCPGILRSS